MSNSECDSCESIFGGNALLVMIDNSAVQSTTWILFTIAILFIVTLTCLRQKSPFIN